MNIEKKTGIIGGGILGMTLAYRLSSKSSDITLFEASENLGGLTAPWKLGNIEWDRFYHVILFSDTYLRNLLRELQLENEIQWKETRTGFYTDKKFYSLSNIWEFIKFPPLSLIDKIRLGFTIYYASKIEDWKELEKIHAEVWLKKLSGEKTFNKIWLPLLKAKLGDNYKITSAAFIWATIQRMYSARKSGSKKEMFGYLPGGYLTILNTLKETLKNKNVKIKTKYSVKTVTKNKNCFQVEFFNGDIECFDKVILTVPSSAAAKICNDISGEEKEKLNKVQYLGVICASLLLKKPLSGFYVTNITHPGINFTGIIEMSALADKKYFDGNTLVYLPKYLHPDDPFFSLTDDQIRDKFLSSLNKIYPEITAGDILEFKIARAKNVFALSTINYSKNLPPIATSIPGLFILNSAHIVNGTLNVNETIQLAEKALNLIGTD